MSSRLARVRVTLRIARALYAGTPPKIALRGPHARAGTPPKIPPRPVTIAIKATWSSQRGGRINLIGSACPFPGSAGRVLYESCNTYVPGWAAPLRRLSVLIVHGVPSGYPTRVQALRTPRAGI